jgi:hypothetical protein
MVENMLCANAGSNAVSNDGSDAVSIGDSNNGGSSVMQC